MPFKMSDIGYYNKSQAEVLDRELRLRRKAVMMAKCNECERVFDLLNDHDIDDWYYGHDCEVEER